MPLPISNKEAWRVGLDVDAPLDALPPRAGGPTHGGPMKGHWTWLGGALLAATAFAASAEPGVTSTTIVIGQSAAFSGPASELGTEMRAGAMAYFQAINAAGGVNGRKIELRSLDDGYEPDRAAANTKKLIDEGVFLLFGYVGTPTSNASKPIFTAARVPFVGPFTGAESLRNPLNRYIFNIRASYFDETDKIVGQLVGQTLNQHRGVLSERRLRQGRTGGRGTRDAEAQPEDRRHRDSGAQHGRRCRCRQGDWQRRPAGRRDDLRVQVLRRVHQGDAQGRIQPAVHERVLRRQQGAGARSGAGGTRRGNLPGGTVSLESYRRA